MLNKHDFNLKPHKTRLSLYKEIYLIFHVTSLKVDFFLIVLKDKEKYRYWIIVLKLKNVVRMRKNCTYL